MCYFSAVYAKNHIRSREHCSHNKKNSTSNLKGVDFVTFHYAYYGSCDSVVLRACILQKDLRVFGKA